MINYLLREFSHEFCSYSGQRKLDYSVYILLEYPTCGAFERGFLNQSFGHKLLGRAHIEKQASLQPNELVYELSVNWIA